MAGAAAKKFDDNDNVRDWRVGQMVMDKKRGTSGMVESVEGDQLVVADMGDGHKFRIPIEDATYAKASGAGSKKAESGQWVVEVDGVVVFGDSDQTEMEKAADDIRRSDPNAVVKVYQEGKSGGADGKKAQPSDKISPDKAKEMLKNPPHGKPLSGPQERMLEAAAHKDDKSIKGSNMNLAAKAIIRQKRKALRAVKIKALLKALDESNDKLKAKAKKGEDIKDDEWDANSHIAKAVKAEMEAQEREEKAAGSPNDWEAAGHLEQLKAKLQSAMDSTMDEEQKSEASTYMKAIDEVMEHAHKGRKAMEDEIKKDTAGQVARQVQQDVQAKADTGETDMKLRAHVKAMGEVLGQEGVPEADTIQKLSEMVKALDAMVGPNPDAQKDKGYVKKNAMDEIQELEFKADELEGKLGSLEPGSAEHQAAEAELESIEKRLDELSSSKDGNEAGGRAEGKAKKADEPEKKDEEEVTPAMKSKLAAMKRDCRRKARLLKRQGINVKLPALLMQ